MANSETYEGWWDLGGFRREVQPRRQHWFLNEKVGFPRPHPRLLLGFQGTKSARREGISSPFNNAGGCTSPQNSGWLRWVCGSSLRAVMSSIMR